MIAFLIRDFVIQEWTQKIDFSSLQPINVKHTTDHLRTRESDQLWKLCINEKWLYLIFHLEFQSVNDNFMEVRTLTYAGLVYLDLIKHQPKNLVKGKLPPIFSLVFYTGDHPWIAPLRLIDCLSPAIPQHLMKY